MAQVQESLDPEVTAQQETNALNEAENQVRIQAISREIARRQAALEDLRYSGGVYSAALQEAYSDLGAFYVEIGELESAREVYVEALQISRINTGLYSADQLPIIRAAIDVNTKLKDWPKIDDLQVLHFHISGRLYDSSEDDYLVAAQLYGDWTLRTLRENLLDENFRELTIRAEDLSSFYGTLIEQLEINQAMVSKEGLDFVVAKAETDLVLARAIATTPYTEFLGTANPTIYQTRCVSTRDSTGQIVQRCSKIQVLNPRYAQSQRDAKQAAVSRQVRNITEAIERLQTIRVAIPDMEVVELEKIDSRIAQLEVEAQMLLRRARSSGFFSL